MWTTEATEMLMDYTPVVSAILENIALFITGVNMWFMFGLLIWIMIT